MSKRTRTNVAELADLTPHPAAVPTFGVAPPRLRKVPVPTVAPNPVNHRDEVGDLSDLASMQKRQLQPCVVVTRAAFLRIYPEHEAALASADFVIVAGTRRRLAAERYEIPTLDIVIQDELAGDRVEFYGSALVENFHRQNLTPLEEARGIRTLAAECGSQTNAARIVGKSQGWVSQRLALLDLSPAMQDHLRSGALLVSDARRFHNLPLDEQEAAWLKERAGQTATTAPETVFPPATSTPPSESVEAPPAPVVEHAELLQRKDPAVPEAGDSGGEDPESAPPRPRPVQIPMDVPIAARADVLGRCHTVDELRELVRELGRVLQEAGG